MRRFPWKANHANEQPCRLICYDTETWQNGSATDPGRTVHTLALGCASLWCRKEAIWSKRKELRFTRPDQFIRFVLDSSRRRETLWIYSHNQAFDATQVGLWNELDWGTFRLTEPGHNYIDPRTKTTKRSEDWHGRLSVDNLPFIVEASSDHGKCRWVDTLNYLPVALATLGNWVGIPKLGKPSESASDEDWFRYCENDLLILERTVMRLLGLWQGRRLGNWQPTIAGLSYSCFRHLEPDSKIVGHGDEEATPEELATYWVEGKDFPLSANDCSTIERRAYYGGRVFVGFVGDIGRPTVVPANGNLFDQGSYRPRIEGPIEAFDVNGLYPYVMATQSFPVELLGTHIDPPMDMASKLIRDFHCIADVQLNSPVRDYPVSLDRRTVFARGRFDTTLAGPELRPALENGDIVKVKTLLVYHSGQPFDYFVRYWWDLRTRANVEGDECTSKLCKAMLNALSGKLGQRTPIWNRVYDIIPPIRWGGFIGNAGDGTGWQRYRSVAGNVQVSQERKDCQHTVTFLSAFITSYGRAFMDELRRKLPYRSVVYQDTDSLFCLPSAASQLHLWGMVDSGELGRMKSQGVFQDAAFYGMKNYDKGDEHVIAGKKSNATRIGERTWLQTHFERCQSLISRPPDYSVHSWEETFNGKRGCPAYSVHADGWTTAIRLG